MKDIPNFPNYQISENGEIYSKVYSRYRKPWANRGGYLYIDLWKNGKPYREAIHRLVAMVYCERPEGTSDVDHIDHNIKNNNYKNLRWVSHRENIHHSYEIMSQVRNFRNCTLEYRGKIIGEFKSVAECCRYAAENFNLSFSTLNRYRKVGEYVVRCND